MLNLEDIYDVTVIGTGPAGLTAAIYTCRADLKTVVFEGNLPGGQLTTTTDVENFPGFREGINGFVLMDEMRNQALRFGAEIHVAMVEKIEAEEDASFTIHLDNGQTFKTRTVILGSGARPRKLGIPGEEEFWANGVSSCAVCDGAFFRDVPLAVVGGGDSAMEEATFLTKFATKVTIIHRRDELRASKIMQQRAINDPKIEFLYSHQVDEVVGDSENGVTHIKIRDRKTDEARELQVAGFFLAIGHIPNTDVFEGLLDMDDEGYITTAPDSTKTNVPGIFAVGDVQDKVYRQAITAAGTGCMGALEAEHYLAALAVGGAAE